MKQYVAGFLISPDLEYVALIKKSRPAWQAGRFNAIGGKVESGESWLEAIRREFREEAGLDIPEWEEFVYMHGVDWECKFFRSWGDPHSCTTQDNEEPIMVFPTQKVKCFLPNESISNLPWLIGIALNLNAGLVLPITIQYA